MESYRTTEETYPTMIFWCPNMSLASKQELVLRSVALLYNLYFSNTNYGDIVTFSWDYKS